MCKYVSESNVKIPKITVKQEERRDQKGKKYCIYTTKVCGDTEDEVIETIKSLKMKYLRMG